MILLFTTVALIALILINVPIAVAIGIVALGGLVLTPGGATLYDMAIALYSGTTSFPLIAIPLFILAGNLMNTSGISVRLINFVTALIGFVRGGLGMVNIGVSMVFAEISGSAVADVAATGTVTYFRSKAWQKNRKPRWKMSWHAKSRKQRSPTRLPKNGWWKANWKG